MGRFSNILREVGLPKYKDTDLPGGGYKRAYKNGIIVYYDKNYQLHRLGGPALYDPVKKYEMWYMHGKKHSTKGYAQYSWGWPPEVENAYFVDGNYMSPEEFHKHFGDDK